MKLSKIKNIKDFSLLVIPNNPGIQTKSYVLGPIKLFLILLAFSVIIFILTILFLALTPAKNVVFAIENEELKSQNEKLELLNERVVFLTRELESLAAMNKRLKFAIALGDSTFLDSLNNEKKKAEQKEEVNPFGGNILAIIQKIFNDDKNQKEDEQNYFIKPIPRGFISRDFNAEKGHFGIDFVVKTGTPVYAPAAGYIIFADYTAADGYMLIISHNHGYITIYKHCSILSKKVRETVVQGELIAQTGNTGLNTTGPHLHFEIWKSGQAIDPRIILLN